jgi:hypothetical protein
VVRRSGHAGVVAPAATTARDEKPRSFVLARVIIPLALLAAVLVWSLLKAWG